MSPQSSDAGVGDESAVSQPAWDVAGQTPMNERDYLVRDALPHCRKPMRCGFWSGHIVACVTAAVYHLHFSLKDGPTNLSAVGE